MTTTYFLLLQAVTFVTGICLGYVANDYRVRRWTKLADAKLKEAKERVEAIEARIAETRAWAGGMYAEIKAQIEKGNETSRFLASHPYTGEPAQPKES